MAVVQAPGAQRELSVSLICEEEKLSESQEAIYKEWEKRVKEYDELMKKHKVEEEKYNKAVKAVDTRVGLKETERQSTGPTKFLRTVPSTTAQAATTPAKTYTTSLPVRSSTTSVGVSGALTKQTPAQNYMLQINGRQQVAGTAGAGRQQVAVTAGAGRQQFLVTRPSLLMNSSPGVAARQGLTPGVTRLVPGIAPASSSQFVPKQAPGVTAMQGNVLSTRTGNTVNLAQFSQRPVPASSSASSSSISKVANTAQKRPAENPSSQENKKVKETLDIKTLTKYHGYKRGKNIPNEDSSRRFKIKCFHCNETMASNIQYADHVKKIVEAQWPNSSNLSAMVVCPRCFKRFRTPFEMQEHMERSHVKGSFFQCFTCDLSFTSNSVLMKHMSAFHSFLQMPFFCQICDYRTSSYADIAYHFASKHTGFKALMCPYCLKMLRCSKTFLGHCQKHIQLSMRSHTGIHPCKSCKLSFLTSAERNEHVDRDHKKFSIHSKDGVPKSLKDLVKSFEIMENAGLGSPAKTKDVVNFGVNKTSVKYVFTQQSGLSKPLSCMECGQQFQYLANHFSRILNCELCSYKTLCPRSLSNHMIIFHKLGREQPKVGVVSKKWHADGTVQLTCKACSYQTKNPTHMAHHRAKKCPDRTPMEWISYLFVPNSKVHSNAPEVIVLDSDDES